jgi:hypothetical protein
VEWPTCSDHKNLGRNAVHAIATEFHIKEANASFKKKYYTHITKRILAGFGMSPNSIVMPLGSKFIKK